MKTLNLLTGVVLIHSIFAQAQDSKFTPFHFNAVLEVEDCLGTIYSSNKSCQVIEHVEKKLTVNLAQDNTVGFPFYIGEESIEIASKTFSNLTFKGILSVNLESASPELYQLNLRAGQIENGEETLQTDSTLGLQKPLSFSKSVTGPTSRWGLIDEHHYTTTFAVRADSENKF